MCGIFLNNSQAAKKQAETPFYHLPSVAVAVVVVGVRINSDYSHLAYFS